MHNILLLTCRPFWASVCTPEYTLHRTMRYVCACYSSHKAEQNFAIVVMIYYVRLMINDCCISFTVWDLKHNSPEERNTFRHFNSESLFPSCLFSFPFIARESKSRYRSRDEGTLSRYFFPPSNCVSFPMLLLYCLRFKATYMIYNFLDEAILYNYLNPRHYFLSLSLFLIVLLLNCSRH